MTTGYQRDPKPLSLSGLVNQRAFLVSRLAAIEKCVRWPALIESLRATLCDFEREIETRNAANR